MKKSLSLIVSVLFAALCLGFSFSAYADDAKVLTDTNVTLSQQSFVYDGTAKNPAVIYNGITLLENTDYTVKYSNNVDFSNDTDTFLSSNLIGVILNSLTAVPE